MYHLVPTVIDREATTQEKYISVSVSALVLQNDLDRGVLLLLVVVADARWVRK